MPNKWTFTIPPISKLIHSYISGGKGWIDHFAGENSTAKITNDLKQKMRKVFQKKKRKR